MLKTSTHNRRIAVYHAMELAAGAAAFFGVWFARKALGSWFQEKIAPLDQILWLPLVFLAFWSVYAWSLGAYRSFRVRGPLSHAYNLAATNALATFSVFGLLMMLREIEINRSLILFTGVANFLIVFPLRLSARRLLTYYTARGYDRHFALVVGSPEEAPRIAATLEALPGAVYQVRGLIAEADAQVNDIRWPVLGSIQDLPAIARREVVDEVFIVPGTLDLQKLHREILELDAMGVVVHLSLPLFEEVGSRLETSHVGDRPFLTFSSAPPSEVQLAIKRFLDLGAALALIVLLSPLLLVTGLLVTLTSKGGAFFRQERVGRNGRRFILLKFRTMVSGAELQRAALESKNELDGPAFKIRNDPRVTRVGKFLRRWSLDELPQLFNVLKGDMSLVGPRPLPDFEVEKFRPWQRRRMNMRPGLTCLWQVGGRNEIAFEEWMRLDLEYIDRWSLWLDFAILGRTLPAVIRGRGAY